MEKEPERHLTDKEEYEAVEADRMNDQIWIENRIKQKEEERKSGKQNG